MQPLEQPIAAMQEPRSISALYDSLADRYDKLVGAARYVGPHWLGRALRAVDPPLCAVDFGCANGVLGRLLRQRFPDSRLVGVDLSAAMLREAARSGDYDALIEQDLDFASPWLGTVSIGLAVALGVSEFLRDPRIFLDEVARALAGGGSLLISFQEFRPHSEGLAPRHVNSGDVIHTAYTVDEVGHLLRARGLCIQGIESLTGYVTSSGFQCPYLMVHALRAQ